MSTKVIVSPKSIMTAADGSLILIFEAPKSEKRVAERMFSEAKEKMELALNPFRKARSLTANAYMWVLIEQLANVLQASKEDIYFEMLKSYGQIATDAAGNKIIFSVKSAIDVRGFYRYLIEIGESEVNGVQFTHYKALKGSSEMDSKEMSILINGVVQECKNLGIETMTPDEIYKMCMEVNK